MISPAPYSVQVLETAHNGYPEWKTFAVRSAQNVCLAVVGEVDRHDEKLYGDVARLFAAAPDLLAACEALNAEVWSLWRKGKVPKSLQSYLEAADAAVIKARGGAK